MHASLGQKLRRRQLGGSGEQGSSTHVLRQPSQPQTSGLQRAPALKHSQYFFKHLERLQRQPRLWPSAAVTWVPDWVGSRQGGMG